MAVRLEAGAGTVHWGYLDAALAPALSIDSGDTVTISTVSGPPDMLPPPPASVPQALYDIHSARTRRVVPAVSSLLSMLPPNWRGWMLETVPQARGGAFAITPKNGRSAISVPQGSRPQGLRPKVSTQGLRWPASP